jgi:hypothetical protein
LAKYNILFCLINIPTLGGRFSQKPRRVAVKKWDKEFTGTAQGEVFPKSAFCDAFFSKIVMLLNY